MTESFTGIAGATYSVRDPHLTNYHGNTLKNPSFVNFYFGKYWETKKGKADAGYLNKFASGLFSSSHMHIWKEYGINKGKLIGSATLPASGRLITDDQIKDVIARQLKKAPINGANSETVYTLFLPPGMVVQAPGDVTSLEGVAGYHGSFDLSPNKTIYYGVVVYSGGSNGIEFSKKPRDNVTIAASHEWTEAVTDPDVANGKLGWYDKNYGEVADIPINLGLPLDQVYGRVEGFAVQKEWSNKDNKAKL